MKTISQLNLEKIRHLKRYCDVLREDIENEYQEVVKILGCDDGNGWLVDYFYNDTTGLEALLAELDIEVNKEFTGDSDHEH